MGKTTMNGTRLAAYLLLTGIILTYSVKALCEVNPSQATGNYSLYDIPGLDEEPVFEVKNALTAGGNVGAYATPTVIVSSQGTILIFVDLRLGDSHDYGNIHEAVCIRSEDDGRTWSEPIRLAFDPERTYYPEFAYVNVHNEIVAVIGGDIPLNTKDGRIVTEKLLLAEPDILKELGSNAPFAMVSKDDGLTWQKTEEIKSFGYGGCWGTYITLKYGIKKGRMIQAARVWLDKVENYKNTPAKFNYGFNCISYSDDGGRTWNKGGLSQPCCGESCVVELSDGRVYLSNRNHSSIRNIRSYAVSLDCGESFAEFGFDEKLIEPICHASMVRYNEPEQGNVILFANPASKTIRTSMTVRASMDDCKSWPVQKLVDPGKTAYSAMTVTPDRTIILVYERGETNSRADIAVARFNISWLFSSEDK